MTRRLVVHSTLGLAAATAAWVAAACAGVPSASHEAPIGSPPPPSPAGEAARAPTATAATPPAASASGLPAESTMAAPIARLPARKSTPGKIACETLDCDLASEVCCVVRKLDETTTGRCVPRPLTPGGFSPCCSPAPVYCANGGMTVDRRCDEAEDCPAGQQCGELDAGEGDLAQQYCKRGWPVEVCLPGSTCMNGNACESDAAATLGRCNLQIAPPTCGNQTCKVGEACCWSVDDKRGACAVTCAEGDLRLACTSAEQCDHSDCDTYPGSGTYECGGGSFQMGVLCRTVMDCPKQLSGLGVYPGGPTIQGCKHRDGLPPNVKECIYR